MPRRAGDRSRRGRWPKRSAPAAADPGPVHLNLPFRDPLVGEPGPLPPGAGGRTALASAGRRHRRARRRRDRRARGGLGVGERRDRRWRGRRRGRASTRSRNASGGPCSPTRGRARVCRRARRWPRSTRSCVMRGSPLITVPTWCCASASRRPRRCWRSGSRPRARVRSQCRHRGGGSIPIAPRTIVVVGDPARLVAALGEAIGRGVGVRARPGWRGGRTPKRPPTRDRRAGSRPSARSSEPAVARRADGLASRRRLARRVVVDARA